MLRVAIPYGTLSSRQLRWLAAVAVRYDRGYGHFTTRQNIQFNWPALVDVPDILEALAEVEMHAIQTSGNVIRNTTADATAGVAADEVADSRIYCELQIGREACGERVCQYRLSSVVAVSLQKQHAKKKTG